MEQPYKCIHVLNGGVFVFCVCMFSQIPFSVSVCPKRCALKAFFYYIMELDKMVNGHCEKRSEENGYV